MESTGNGDLPEELVWEILLRLPVKTLLRFKCVCKQWCALIGSPSFVNQHFDHESNQEHLFVRHCAPDLGYAYALFVDETFQRYEEPAHLQMPDPVSALMGPLNGVFCVVTRLRGMALLNPAMRQFKPLPSRHPNVQPSIYHNVLGFGLDPFSGDYKLVSIEYLWKEEMDALHYFALVSVYNSSSDSWRHLEDVDLINSNNFAYQALCNTYLNGVYYWLMEVDDDDIAIIAFEMSSEKFREIQVPDCVIKSKTANIALCGDSLALLEYNLDKADKYIEVWIMKSEGCWVRSLTVGPFEHIPLGFWKKNLLLLGTRILGSRTSPLALCNVSTRKLSVIRTREKGNYYGSFLHWVFSYKESLFSIKGEGDKCNLWDTSSQFVRDFFKYSSRNSGEAYAISTNALNLG